MDIHLVKICDKIKFVRWLYTQNWAALNIRLSYNIFDRCLGLVVNFHLARLKLPISGNLPFQGGFDHLERQNKQVSFTISNIFLILLLEISTFFSNSNFHFHCWQFKTNLIARRTGEYLRGLQAKRFHPPCVAHTFWTLQCVREGGEFYWALT